MEEIQLRNLKGFSNPSHIQLIDKTLGHLNILIGANISLQEIIVSILKHNVTSEFGLLKQIHALNKRLTSTAQEFNSKIQTLSMMRQIEVGDNIFRRLYSRLIEKLARKFSVYEAHRRTLSFMGPNIKNLYAIYEQSLTLSTQTNFTVLLNALKLIVKENSQLYQLTLDLLVSQNYVSSIQEFNLLDVNTQIKPQTSPAEAIESDQPQQLHYVQRKNRKQETVTHQNNQNKLTIQDLFKRLKDHNSKVVRSSGRMNNLQYKSALRRKETSRIYNSLQKMFLESMVMKNRISSDLKEHRSSELSSLQKYDNKQALKDKKISKLLVEINDLTSIYDAYKPQTITKKSSTKFSSVNKRGDSNTKSSSHQKTKIVLKSAFGKCLEKKPLKSVKNIMTQQNESETRKRYQTKNHCFYSRFKTVIDEIVDNVNSETPKQYTKELFVLEPCIQQQQLPDEIQGLMTISRFRSPQASSSNNDIMQFAATAPVNGENPFTPKHCQSAQSVRPRGQTERQCNLKSLNENRLKRIRTWKAKLAKLNHKYEVFCPRELTIVPKSLL